MDNTLPRSERLRGKTTVSRLFSEGESGFVYPIRYVWRPSGGEVREATSVLFTVPKKFHRRANKRNLLRRRCKEAYRLQKELLGGAAQGYELALIYSSKEVEEYARIARSMAKILELIKATTTEG